MGDTASNRLLLLKIIEILSSKEGPRLLANVGDGCKTESTAAKVTSLKKFVERFPQLFRVSFDAKNALALSLVKHENRILCPAKLLNAVCDTKECSFLHNNAKSSAKNDELSPVVPRAISPVAAYLASISNNRPKISAFKQRVRNFCASLQQTKISLTAKQEQLKKLPLMPKDIVEYYPTLFTVSTCPNRYVSIAKYPQEGHSYVWEMCVDYAIETCSRGDYCPMKHSMTDKRIVPRSLPVQSFTTEIVVGSATETTTQEQPGATNNSKIDTPEGAKQVRPSAQDQKQISTVSDADPVEADIIQLQDALAGDSSVKWVRTAAEAKYVEKLLLSESFVAIDAEFQNEDLALVQINAQGITYLFDFQISQIDRVGLIRCLRSLMQQQSIGKVFHDSRQDIFMFKRRGILTFNSIFDTQVLYQLNQTMKREPEHRIGLGVLLKKYGFKHDSKDEIHDAMKKGTIDWTVRPMDAKLIKYAIADVVNLVALYRKLKAEQESLEIKVYKTYSTSLIKNDPVPERQTYAERTSVRPNERYRLVFNSEKKPNYYPLGTEINNTNVQVDYREIHEQNERELEALIMTLPENIQPEVWRVMREEQRQLIEVVVDYGQKLCLRFEGKIERLIDGEVKNIEEFIKPLQEATNSDFRGDNRMGMEGTLHRISVMRNKNDKPVGLTYRVGRHMKNTCELIEDYINEIIRSSTDTPLSVLLIGAPGVGKTTLLREISARLSNSLGRSVLIVDTSNEIGGDGDAPHRCIGSARRMQVPDSKGQHDVMIEAIQNHNPSVIIIDEIGTSAEVRAAKTIGQRGVQLIATAHGTSLDSLMKNPDLVALIGGIQPVIVGDRDAVVNKDGTKEKIVLRRAGDPTFNVVIEMMKKDQWRIYKHVALVIDAKLAKTPYSSELRWVDRQQGQPVLMAMLESHNSETVKDNTNWLDAYKQ